MTSDLLPPVVIAWLALMAPILAVGWTMQFRFRMVEFRDLAPRDPNEPPPPPDKMQRRYNALKVTNFVGALGGFVVANLWGQLAGVPLSAHVSMAAPDWPRFIFWTAVLVGFAIGWGTWIWRATPTFPAQYGVAIIACICWGLAFAILGTA